MKLILKTQSRHPKCKMIRAKSRRNYKNILYVLTLIRQPVEFFMTTHS